MAKTELVISATEFKAKCLELLDQVSTGKLKRVTVTKRGKPVADVQKPKPGPGDVRSIFGALGTKAAVPPGLDLTEPVYDPAIDGPLYASMGVLYVDGEDRGIGPDGRVVGYMRDLVRRDLAKHRRARKARR